MRCFAFVMVLSLLVISAAAHAAPLKILSLQGKLTDGVGANAYSFANFIFRIYDDPLAGTKQWEETQASVPIESSGVFSVLLGSITPLNLSFGSPYWIEVEVQGGANPSQILNPRQRIGGAGYSIRSENPWNQSGNNIYTTNTGTVGIGSISPGDKLFVSGNVSWAGTLQGGSVPWIRMSAFPPACSAGKYVTAVGSTLTCSDIVVPAGANGWSTSGTFVYNDTAGVNLGLGIATPATKMHIYTQQESVIRLQEASLTPNPSTYMEFFNVTNRAGLVGFQGTSYLGMTTYNGRHIVLNPSGNVGVGVVSPGAKLDIAGSIKIVDGTQGAGKVLTSDATGLASWQASPAGGVPSGAVMFFNLTSCPLGWVEFTSARGRYVVGLSPGGSLAATAGTALSNLENRSTGQHSHTFVVRSEGGGIPSTDPTYNTPGAVMATPSTSSEGSVPGTNAPYIQLLVCQKI